MPAVKGHAYVRVTIDGGHRSFVGLFFLSSRLFNRFMHALNGNGTLVNPLDLSKSRVFDYLKNAYLLPLIEMRQREVVYHDAGAETDRLLQCQYVSTPLGGVWMPTAYVLEFLTKLLSNSFDDNVDLINLGFVTVSRFARGDIVGYIDGQQLIELGEAKFQGFSLFLAAHWNRLMHSSNGNTSAAQRRTSRRLKYYFIIFSIFWICLVLLSYVIANILLIANRNSRISLAIVDFVLKYCYPLRKIIGLIFLVHVSSVILILALTNWGFQACLAHLGFNNGVDVILEYSALDQFRVVERTSTTDPKKAIEFAGMLPRFLFENRRSSLYKNGSIRGFNNRLLSKLMDVKTFTSLERIRDFYSKDYEMLLDYFTIRKNPDLEFLWDLQDSEPEDQRFITAVPMLSLITQTNGDGWQCRHILQCWKDGRKDDAKSLLSTAIAYRNGIEDHRLPENAHDVAKEYSPHLVCFCQLKVPKISGSFRFSKQLGMTINYEKHGFFTEEGENYFIPYPIFMRFYLTHDQLFETLATKYCSLEVAVPHNQVMLDVRRNTFYNFGMELLKIQSDMPVLLESVRKIKVENAIYENKVLCLNPSDSAPQGF